ncbi:unannotated protein [freshwater metagenome]|uniref:Unannotated protein n=1 Tax=freshwater metagenome TaxID=449393 RepID=A0A6J7E8N9_9ZZZZ
MDPPRPIVSLPHTADVVGGVREGKNTPKSVFAPKVTKAKLGDDRHTTALIDDSGISVV